MSLVVAEQDLYRACEVIFGPKLDLSRDFLQYLQLSGVKSAYRKRALETHPDRFAALDEDAGQQGSGTLFHDVHQAYENLLHYLQARERGILLPGGRRPGSGGDGPQPGDLGKGGFSRRPTTDAGLGAGRKKPPHNRPPDGSSCGSPCWDIEALYQGPLPNRRLLLGHFLYYSGIASWRTIVQALIWQRSNRPKIGEISRRLGILDEAAIAMILKNRSGGQPFGEFALKLGLLDQNQLRLLIQAQKRMQHKFGQYFIRQGLLQPRQLLRLLRECHDHNNRLAREFAGRRP
ncbi:MAG: J domain-containing protein [Desulfurivibrio sp.]